MRQPTLLANALLLSILTGCGADPKARDSAGGASGTDAADGADGTDETDGTDGADGTDGTDGADGTDGTDGPDCAPPDADPAPTREGHPGDGWRWTRLGLLFADEETLGYGDGDLSPALVRTETGLHLLFSRQRGTGQTLWVSTSTDGTSWTPPVEATGLEPSTTDYPSLLPTAAGFRLWYGSGSIDMAESTDGFAFREQGTAIRAGEAGRFDSLSLLYPHIHAPEGEDGPLALYYTGYDGVDFAIGRSESTDGGATWTTGALVLEADPAGWDNAAVAMPAVVTHAGTTHVWYGGYDTVIANPGPWRVGMLAPDGSRRVSLPLTESGVEAWSTRDPSVVPWGDGWLMVYVAMGDDGVYRLAHASSDVCH